MIVEWQNDKLHNIENRSFEEMPLKMNGELLLRFNETNFLGVNVNCKLSWSIHIWLIASKISESIGILDKVRYTLNKLSCLQ